MLLLWFLIPSHASHPDAVQQKEWGESPPAVAPKIIFSSRTHSQLSQAIKEALSTSYAPKICVLGSRDQLCINEEVMKVESNSAKTQICRQKTAKRQCEFYNNIDATKAAREAGGDIHLMDIEVRLHSHC